MSDDKADQQNEYDRISSFVEGRIAPLLGELFDGYVIAGVGVDGSSRVMFFGGTDEGRKAPELREVLHSAICFAEGDSNSSHQPGGGN